MNIVSTQYSLKHKALEIYVSGCDGICGESCHNYELRNFNLGEDYSLVLPKILSKIQSFDDMIDNIWILGGEPLLQDLIQLKSMIQTLKSTNKNIWLFTRFEYEDVVDLLEDLSDIEYVKCGRYVKDLKTEDNIQYGIKLATSNQYIIYINSNIQNGG